MAKIVVKLAKCRHTQDGCSKCVDECPMQLLRIEWFSKEAEFVIEEEMCIECRNCEVTCPEKAIEVTS
jgi:NAD-dependent dihydropyrimidine dehydrogenase PreA subunit